MKIGIIGPTKLKDEEKVLAVSRIISKLDYEVVLTPDKESISEFFARKYLEFGGKKVYSIIPLKDKEFGNSWVQRIGEVIDCSIWRNQPEKLNEESDILISLGYSPGSLIEICYSKWFKKKPVYILKDFIQTKLPEELENSLDLHYIFINELEKNLKRIK